MGTTFQAQTASAEAPQVEEGLADLRFEGTTSKRVKGGKYTKDTENGDLKLVWLFTLLDDDGNVVREDREDHENFGKPIVLDKLTGTGFNINASTVPAELKVLKALMSPAEYAAFEEGAKVDEDELKGRVVQGEIFVNDKGWPGIGNIIPARKARKAKAATE